MLPGSAEAPQVPHKEGKGLSHAQVLGQGPGCIASSPRSRHGGHPLLLTHRVSPSETRAGIIQDSVKPHLNYCDRSDLVPKAKHFTLPEPWFPVC